MERKDLNKKENKSISLMSMTVDKVKSYPNYSYGQKDIPFSFKVEEMLDAML